MFWNKITRTEKNYIEFLYKSNCFRIGQFRIKSGREAPYFIDMQESFNSLTLTVVGKAYANKITKEFTHGSFDAILGPAEKGTGLGISTCLQLPDTMGKVLIIWDRKQPKDYGTHKRPSWLVGPESKIKELLKQKKGISIIMVDDVISTGATKKASMEKVQGELLAIAEEIGLVEKPKIRWLKLVISANRCEIDEEGHNPIEVAQKELGVPVVWVTDSYNIFGHLFNKGLIDSKALSCFVEYAKKYGLPEDNERLVELESVI